MGIFEALTLILSGTTIICFWEALKHRRKRLMAETILAKLLFEMLEAEKLMENSIQQLAEEELH